jgi:hypothetical protein
MKTAAHSVVLAFAFAVMANMVANIAAGATLEQLSVEQMAQKATAIVRGRVSGCTGEMRGSVIYTRCTVAVTERWKGQTPPETDFITPGGAAQGLVQIFTGTPKFTNGDEHVLFLWAGRSGIYQIIGLSQGKFDLKVTKAGEDEVYRSAAAERMLDKAGNDVQDQPVSMTASELRRRVKRALAAEPGERQ